MGCMQREGKPISKAVLNSQTEELDSEGEPYSRSDVLALYSSNSVFIGIGRNFAIDLTDFYALKPERSILINCSDLLHNTGL